MLDSNYFIYPISTVIDQYFTPQGIEPLLFHQTFKVIVIRDTCKKTYHRNRGGYVEKRIFFTIVKSCGSFGVLTLVTSTIDMIHSFFKESMDPPPGHTFIDWLVENRISVYDYETEHSAKYCVSKMTKAQLKTKVNTKLVNSLTGNGA